MDGNSSEDEGSQAATTTQRTASVQSSVASSVLPLTALARSKYGNFEEKSKRKGGVPLVSKTVTDPDSFAAVGGVPEHVAALRRELQRGDDDLVACGLAPPPVAPGAKQMTKAAIARKAAVATRSGRAQKAAAAPEVEQKLQAAVIKGLDPGEEARRQRIAYRMKFFNDPRVVTQLEEAAAKGQKKTTGASRSSSAAGVAAQPAGRGLSRSASTVTSKSQGGGVRETKASQLRRGASFASKPSSSVGGDGDAVLSYDGTRRDTFMRATSFASNKHQREASKERSRSAGRTRGGGADGTSEGGASALGGGGDDDDGNAWETRSAAAAAARTTPRYQQGSPSPRRGQPPQPTRNIFGGNKDNGECPTSYATCVQSNLSASAAWVSAQCR